MSKIFIDDIVCKVIDDYGPCPGAVGTAIKYRKNEEAEKWLTNIEIAGFPNFYLTDEYVLDSILFAETEEETDKAEELGDKYSIESFEGISLWDYIVTLEDIKECKDGAVAKLIIYLLEVALCGADETGEFIEKGKGKYVSDISVPDIDTFIHELRRV